MRRLPLQQRTVGVKLGGSQLILLLIDTLVCLYINADFLQTTKLGAIKRAQVVRQTYQQGVSLSTM